MSIKNAILGILSWKTVSGYEIKKIFEESSSMYWSGNNNQIYKALLQLQNEGLVTCVTENQVGGPSKKNYTITSEGISELKEWLIDSTEAPEFKKTFLIKLAWSELLDDKELFEIVSKYETQIKMQILLLQEKTRRGIISPKRTNREEYLWDMIDENVILSYKNEMEWVGKLKNYLSDDKMEASIMNFEIKELAEKKYIEIYSNESPICKEQDALDIISISAENDIRLIMLNSEVISDDFLNLKTGVAGSVMQKFVNYNLKVVAVIPHERIKNGKFKNVIIESNRGKQFRVFEEREKAINWLLED